jgi:hypothetical protein
MALSGHCDAEGEGHKGNEGETRKGLNYKTCPTPVSLRRILLLDKRNAALIINLHYNCAYIMIAVESKI